MKKIILFVLLFSLLPIYILAAETETQPDTGVEVPIIMYHLITERPKYIGKYGVTPKELESDLQYLQANGYTTVVMKDLIDFVEHGTPLPPKPIVLTFDDGNFSDYEHLYPLLKQYQMKAVLAIIGEAADRCTKMFAESPTGRYPNLTWAQAKELHDSGFFEIQSHGYNVHGRGGSGEKKSEAIAAYHARLYDDLNKLQNLCETHLGRKPDTFVYPLGVIGKDSRTVLEQLGMKASLSCHEGINVLRQGDKDCLFKMHRYNRPSGQSIGRILDKIDKLKR